MSTVNDTVECKGDNVNLIDTENGGPFKKPTFAAPSVAGKRRTQPSCSNEASSAPESQVIKVVEDVENKHAVSPNDQDPQATGSSVPFDAGEVADSEKPPEGTQCNSTRSPGPRIKDVKQKHNIPSCGLKPNPPLPYTEPQWGGVADMPYAVEVLKNGAIVNRVPLTQQGYFVVGRLPVCDISLEHPSISRYHAVLQYRGQSGDGEETGFYVYDLSSTHGTSVNKRIIPPNTYIRLRVGHVLKFGASTRLFILQGPQSDEEAESELTVTQLRERARKQRELEKKMMGDGSDEEKEEDGEKGVGTSGRSLTDDSGCSWGMGEEAAPEDENEENPFATEFQEDQDAAYLKDPKKALQGFYDREGEELEFEYEEKGHGSWLCRIRLPVDDAHGRQLVAEVTHTGKKKEASIQCSLEACRILEARGLLRQEAISRKRRKKNWEEEDFYDSDDDSFLDRTGTVEKKREERMKRAKKVEDKPDSYESLILKLKEVEQKIAETEKKLCSSGTSGPKASSDDPLDAYMNMVYCESKLDGVERKRVHIHIAELRSEAQRLHRLIDLTRPTQLPSLQTSVTSSNQEKTKIKALPLFGAMKGGSKLKLKTGTLGKLPPKPTALPSELFNMKEMPPSEEEEEEEEEDEEDDHNIKEDDHCMKEDQLANLSTLRENETRNIPMPDRLEEEQCYSPEDLVRPPGMKVSKFH
ncbi:hypothetical protein ACEWY4_005898 [Coilia grayii]|uniref:FHA domain-containing protein n=1 Tax=Coilia grayii TaxID=363190 RepID=A0ABD1KJV0_9TELE